MEDLHFRCPHCDQPIDQDVIVSYSAKLAQRKSASSRRGNSDAMRALVRKRWDKKRKKSPSKDSSSND